MTLLPPAGCVEEHPAWLGQSTSGGTGADDASSSASAQTSATTTNPTSSSSSTGDGTDSGASGTTSSGGGTATSSTTTGATTDTTGSTGGVASRRIFVSETTRYGAFGGQSQADAVCQSQADGASLGGTWRALLSTPAVDARDALALQGPLLNMMDEVVAMGDADLWDGALAAPIAYDQFGAVSGSRVWTGTAADGTAAVDTCEGWTAPTGNVDGSTGDAQVADNTWTSWEPFPCSQSAHFYCVSD